MKKTSMKNSLFLFMAALIWGFAFVAQSVGMDYMGPFTFNCVRNLIGAFVLIPCIFLLNYLKTDEEKKAQKAKKEDKRKLFLGGLACGTFLFLASNAQQIGIMSTSVGKAGFLTALYIVIVPVFGIFFGKKCGIKVWSAVLIALIGFYFLTMKGSFSLGRGDMMVVLSAFLFSGHILTIDYFSADTDGVKMSCIQFFVCGILSGIVMLFREEVQISQLFAAWQPILYAGVLSCGCAYTFQIIGQKDYNPTIASLILSLESVFSALAGWLILDQVLSARELGGCALIFAAIILTQLPDRKKTE